MDAEVFAIVEHDDLAAALVIDFRAFHERCHHGVTDVIRPETVAVVAQVETFEFLGFWARLEQRVFDNFVAVCVVVHFYGHAFLRLVAAPVPDN